MVGNEKFSMNGVTPLESGYTSVFTWQALEREETVPDLKEGDELPITESKMVEKETSPPEHLTESELITLMERHGIGTDASIPVHINNICLRNYVTIGSGRKLIPTTLGIVLVHGYQKVRNIVNMSRFQTRTMDTTIFFSSESYRETLVSVGRS
jgi:DNA topoisomerase-3